MAIDEENISEGDMTTCKCSNQQEFLRLMKIGHKTKKDSNVSTIQGAGNWSMQQFENFGANIIIL